MGGPDVEAPGRIRSRAGTVALRPLPVPTCDPRRRDRPDDLAPRAHVIVAGREIVVLGRDRRLSRRSGPGARVVGVANARARGGVQQGPPYAVDSRDAGPREADRRGALA